MGDESMDRSSVEGDDESISCGSTEGVVVIGSLGEVEEELVVLDEETNLGEVGGV